MSAIFSAIAFLFIAGLFIHTAFFLPFYLVVIPVVSFLSVLFASALAAKILTIGIVLFASACLIKLFFHGLSLLEAFITNYDQKIAVPPLPSAPLLESVGSFPQADLTTALSHRHYKTPTNAMPVPLVERESATYAARQTLGIGYRIPTASPVAQI
ncbi:MAG TPA: hypothetical protein VJB02_00500 [Coxiellaceae bacterium]|nr:hypothetical protein [Coxiellaceae bacterium]